MTAAYVSDNSAQHKIAITPHESSDYNSKPSKPVEARICIRDGPFLQYGLATYRHREILLRLGCQSLPNFQDYSK